MNRTRNGKQMSNKHITEIWPPMDKMPNWATDAIESGQLFTECFKRIEGLAAEIMDLRGLVQCTECSKELGTSDYHGWMAGICPGCQAEMYPSV